MLHNTSVDNLPLDLDEFVSILMSEEGHDHLRTMGWTEESVTCLYQIFVEWTAWKTLDKLTKDGMLPGFPHT